MVRHMVQCQQIRLGKCKKIWEYVEKRLDFYYILLYNTKTMINTLKHFSTPCSMLSSAWQADYRSTPRSENLGFIGNNVGSCEGRDD